MKVSLNKEEFTVKEGEFPTSIHPEYTDTKLIPELGVFEREIGLIRDIVEGFKESYSEATYINYGLSHGGYVPIKLAPYFANMYVITDITDVTDVTSIANNNLHVVNFITNKSEYDKEDKIDIVASLDNIVIGDKFNIVRIDDRGINKDNKKYLREHVLKHKNTIILSYDDIGLEELDYNCYELEKSETSVYIPKELNARFRKEFRYYLTLASDSDSNIGNNDSDDGNVKNDYLLKYDNLINICIMVKNAGNGWANMLESNKKYMDRWTILDTGSTDNTIKIAKEVLKDKKGDLYEEPFINFRDSRNRLLDLAGTTCKFTIMLDDSHILDGDMRKLLNGIRTGAEDVYSINITSGITEFYSSRILKTEREIRYTYKVHEVITAPACVLPSVFKIYDVDDKKSIDRTESRAKYDLKLLFEELDEGNNISRQLYYIAITYARMKNWDKAIEYYMKRINCEEKGYVEEIAESYYVAAHIGDTCLGWNWEKCKKMYLDGHNITPSNPKFLYMIGNHYFSEKNYDDAYKYLKKAFNLGSPSSDTLQLSITPIIYNSAIPYALVHVCYEGRDFRLGEQAAKKYLKYNPNDTSIEIYHSTFSLINRSVNKSQKTKSDKPIICFVINKVLNKSEYNDKLGSFAIKLAENIVNTHNWNVFIFCRTENEEIHENVLYANIDNYVKFINTYEVHLLLLFEHPEYISVSLLNNIKDIFLIMCDITFDNYAIPSGNMLKGILTMTNLNRLQLIKIYPSLDDITETLPNYIDMNEYQIDKLTKIPQSFIYASMPNSGLLNLLKIFPKIRKHLPDATLNIFYSPEDTLYVLDDTRAENEHKLSEINELLEKQKEYITYHKTNDDLHEYWHKSEYWFNPLTSFEDPESCPTVLLKAAASKTLVIVPKFVGLYDIIGDRGIIIYGNSESEEWQEEAIDMIVHVNDPINHDIKNDILERNRIWASEHGWLNLTHELIKLTKVEHINEPAEPNLPSKQSEPDEQLGPDGTQVDPEILNVEYVCKNLSHCRRILEINSEDVQSPLKSYFANRIDVQFLSMTGTNCLSFEKLPFDDDAFDFVYCRNKLEKVYNPEIITKELFRIAKHGYIETASPFIELTRFIDGNTCYYRGCASNKYIIWSYKNTLKFLPKLPLIEYMDIDETFEEVLDPFLRNTHFIWNKEKKCNNPICQFINPSTKDFQLDYELIIKRAILESAESTTDYKNNILNYTKSKNKVY